MTAASICRLPSLFQFSGEQQFVVRRRRPADRQLRMKLEMENTTLPSMSNTAGLKPRWASFEFYPETESCTMYVFKGVSYEDLCYGTRRETVVKALKAATASEGDWQPYCNRASKARELAKSFNQLLLKHSSRMKVQFVNPHVAAMEKVFTFTPVVKFFKPYNKTLAKGEHVVFESHIEGDFQTFVGKGGAMDTALGSVLQSFAHYSFYKSDGNFVITDLKGVLESNDFILTVPIIHSKTREYGAGDKGLSGIREFFTNHSCTAICSAFPKLDDRHPFQALQPSAPLTEHVYPPPVYSYAQATSGLPLPPPYAEKCSHEALSWEQTQLNNNISCEISTEKDLPTVHNSCNK